MCEQGQITFSNLLNCWIYSFGQNNEFPQRVKGGGKFSVWQMNWTEHGTFQLATFVLMIVFIGFFLKKQQYDVSLHEF